MSVGRYVKTDCPDCGDPIPIPLWVPRIESYHLTIPHYGNRGSACRIALTVHPGGRVEGAALADATDFEEVHLNGGKAA